MAKLKLGTNDIYVATAKKAFNLSTSTMLTSHATHGQIIEMTMNSSGVRDIGHVLKINPTTVIDHLKNFRPAQ